jgi:hypothetical protein
MIKAALLLLCLSVLAGCGTAPAPTRSKAQPYTVISEQADPAASTLTLAIKVSGSATQPAVQSIAEAIIAERKGEYRHIIVKSYAEGMTASDSPLAVSRLEDGTVKHRFNPLGETQKIQTH